MKKKNNKSIKERMKHFMKKKNTKRMIYFGVVGVFVFIIGLFMPKWLKYGLHIDWFPFNGIEYNKGVLLEFYGSIFSILITVLVLAITVIVESKERREEDLLMYKPIIEFIGMNKKEGYTYKRIYLKNKYSPKENQIKYHEYRLVFKNVGRGESENTIFNIDGISEQSEINPDIKNNLYLQFEEIANKQIEEIIAGDCFGIHLELPDMIYCPSNYGLEQESEIIMKMNVTYEDMFKKENYLLNINVAAKIMPCKLSMKRNNYIKVKYKDIKVSPSKHDKFVDYWYDPQ